MTSHVSDFLRVLPEWALAATTRRHNSFDPYSTGHVRRRRRRRRSLVGGKHYNNNNNRLHNEYIIYVYIFGALFGTLLFRL